MTNLFVGGLAWHTQEDSLEQAFGPYGQLLEVAVIRDRDNPTRSKGYGFVKFATEEQANQAIARLNGTELDGRIIRVDKAQDSGRAGPSARGRRAGGAGGVASAAPSRMPYTGYSAVQPQQSQQQYQQNPYQQNPYLQSQQQQQQQQPPRGQQPGQQPGPGQEYPYGAGPRPRGYWEQ